MELNFEKVFLNKSGEVVCDSLQIAEDFEKNHYNILKIIKRKICEKSKWNFQNYFIESEYKIEGNNKTYKKYLITRDGFSFLVMSFTGSKFDDFKIKYIEEFNKMEKEVEEQRIKNIKAITMIFSHRDKLSLTYDSLYPILNELGVLNAKRSQVHNIIKKALIGKYENVRMDKAFNEADFIEDYKLLAEQMKEKYSGYFVDNNQVNWFDCLEV